MHKLTIKSPGEIEIMAEGGEKLAQVRDALEIAAQPGVSGQDLEKLANDLIYKCGSKPSFKMVQGYHWATCININETVVHGIPDGRKFKTGDIVGIDVGLYYRGYHTDTSVTVVINNYSNQKFLDVGKAALKKAIAKAKIGNRIADISEAMQSSVEAAGYSAVRALTGHGIGRYLHEEPAIPCFVLGKYEHSPKIEVGMVLAIEIMYNLGVPDVVYQNEDGWTIATADGKISGLFEETVAVTSKGPRVLTHTKKL